MHVAALVDQVTTVPSIDPDGRLRTDRGPWAMDGPSRRAVAQAAELAAAVGDGVCTALTVGAAPAEDVLRDAVAWGHTSNVTTFGVLVDDAGLEGTDSLGTAGALAAVMARETPFDLVLLGDASSDIGTGQLGPQLAELMDLACVAGARYLSMQGRALHVRAQREDGWLQATVALPAVVSCAAGLIEPCDEGTTARATVPAERIRHVGAAELGPGPWSSPDRRLDIRSAAATDVGIPSSTERVPAARGVRGPAVAVVVEPGRPDLARRLLAEAAALAITIDGHVIAVDPSATDLHDLGAWGADAVVGLLGQNLAEDVARGLADWIADAEPWAALVPSSAWGREVAGRAAARLGAGLAGGVTALSAEAGRLVAWKRAHEDRVIARITSSSDVQLATLRVDTARPVATRDFAAARVQEITVHARSRLRVRSRTRAST